ncbi:MAG: RNA polymerase sporulation sigma factor SigK [Clostridiales bacterium]|jgi:RNA polymerase sporulation-specific sigma factor|nr:RNA polymerase sporulation sigma factor SigK [Clostridiales bacterium]
MFESLLDMLVSSLLYLVLHISNNGSFPPPLSAAKEKEYLEALSNGDMEAKKKLIEHNLRLVVHIIKKYYSSNSEQEDLISIGTIGLIKGINTYDLEKGTRLATYAARCIENEILMHFRNQRKKAQDISVSEPIDIDGEGNPLTLMDIICTDDTIIDDLDLKIKSEKLHKYLAEIDDAREKLILTLRYGLFGHKIYTQREVAKLLKISRSYVSRLEKKALLRLKKKFKSDF